MTDLTGVVGFVITIVGFAVTIYKTSKSTAAAEQAKIAAQSAEREINKIEGFIDLSGAIAAMEAVKTLHREGAWAILPDRYANARKLLIGVRERTANLTQTQIEAINGSILNFSGLERQIEKHHLDPSKINIGRANAALSEDIDRLVELLHSIRSGQKGL